MKLKLNGKFKTTNQKHHLTIEQLLRSNQIENLKELLPKIHHSEIGIAIKRLEPSLKIKLFQLLDVDQAADVLLDIDRYSLGIILGELSKPELSQIVKEMEADEATDIVGTMPIQERTSVLQTLPEEASRELAELLKYPENTAGGRMTIDFLPLLENETIGSALRKVRANRTKVQPTNLFFVTDDLSKLQGYVYLTDLVFTSPRMLVKRITKPCPFFAHVLDDQEQTIQAARKYEMTTVPVVDDAGVLKGIITSEDIIKVIEEEASEDIAKLGHAYELESAFSPITKSVRRRLPWLYIDLLGAFVAALVIGSFEQTLKTMITVAAFMPVISEMGGATGSQVIAIIVRSLALGEITFNDAKRLLLKELKVGLCTGGACGIVTAFVAIIFRGSPLLGLIVFGALVINMIVGAITGLMLPLILSKLKRDPALASGLLLTAVTDAIGLFALLGLTALAIKIFGLH
ncbi:MAG: magnesium transporter [candidate division WOR-3 bacterium]|nr:magnesium transporter [candidate division WOR-3 bacterium]